VWWCFAQENHKKPAKPDVMVDMGLGLLGLDLLTELAVDTPAWTAVDIKLHVYWAFVSGVVGPLALFMSQIAFCTLCCTAQWLPRAAHSFTPESN
jgi:hypothetical protein